jgi:hypothetical protein
VSEDTFREHERARLHNIYLLNRERYKRRAEIRYALQREEICQRFRERYRTDPQFREKRIAMRKETRLRRQLRGLS